MRGPDNMTRSAVRDALHQFDLRVEVHGGKRREVHTRFARQRRRVAIKVTARPKYQGDGQWS